MSLSVKTRYHWQQRRKALSFQSLTAIGGDGHLRQIGGRRTRPTTPVEMWPILSRIVLCVLCVYSLRSVLSRSARRFLFAIDDRARDRIRREARAARERATNTDAAIVQALESSDGAILRHDEYPSAQLAAHACG